MEGGHQGKVMDVLGDERYRREVPDGPRLCGKKTLVLPNRGGLLTGVAEEFEIREFGPDGELQRVLSAPVERRRLTDEELNTSDQRQISGVARQYGPEVVNALKENLLLNVSPGFLPAYDRAFLDDEKRFWVRGFQALPDPVEIWEVFNLATGSHLGSVSSPVGFALMEVAGGFAVGVRQDENDVEYVNLYRLLQRPSP